METSDLKKHVDDFNSEYIKKFSNSPYPLFFSNGV